MAKKKKQFYAVVHGRRPGLYSQWSGASGASAQVEGFTGAIYRGFYTREEALAWLGQFGREKLAHLAPKLLELIEESPQIASSERPEDLLAVGKILIYTDGGSIGNPGPGGYGVILRHKGHRKELSAGFRQTTNNRMELMACIEGLRALKARSSVVLFSDSKYVVNAMVQGWALRWQAAGWKRAGGQEVKNADLWRQLLEACRGHDVEFRWTRGHSGNPDNERCDRLATEAARRKHLAVDQIFESAR